MRRSVPVIAATAGTLALLASFHTSPGGRVATRTPPSPTGSAGAPTSTTPGGPTLGGASTSPPGSSPPSTATGTRVIDGPDITNDYGDVQVRVTVRGHQILDVQALKLPSDRARSVRISQYAEPRLRAEALQAQSALIDLVSGASYTSDSYAQSLQGALDQAGK
jgi:hypothetical protein